ncbi:LysR family transcriptional regulator [Thalassospira sp. NFXS8]|uniref:LysR family transcriptional regulator n=1 Tax=Thalassospira sp. NFXS8 TaxID=2819093 RepID=UPI0032DEFF75
MKQAQHLLNLPRLAAFVAICEEGSLSKASHRLGIAQPALSTTIKKIEDDLGVPVLTRHARGSVPTAAGRVLLKSAYEMLGIAEATLEEIGTTSSDPEGEVAIGLPAATSMVLAVPLIKHLRKSLPKVSLRVVETFSGYLWNWLQDGNLDVAVTFDRVSIPEIVCLPLCKEDLFLIGNSKLLKNTPDHISPHNLYKFPLILPSRIHGIRGKAEAFAASGKGLDIRMEIDASTHLVKLIAAGEGFGLLAKCAVTDELAQKTVRAIPLEPSLSRQVSLGIRRIKMQNPVVARVVEEMQHISADLIRAGTWPTSDT